MGNPLTGKEDENFMGRLTDKVVRSNALTVPGHGRRLSAASCC
jgi:hypothetical protein